MNRRGFLAGSAALAGSGLNSQSTFAKNTGGFFVPPEESQHQRTFMQWPVSCRVYRDRVFLDMTQRTIGDIANTISEFEPVTILTVWHGLPERVVC